MIVVCGVECHSRRVAPRAGRRARTRALLLALCALLAATRCRCVRARVVDSDR